MPFQRSAFSTRACCTSIPHNGGLWVGECDHEPVTLIFDHVAAVVVDQVLDEPVVPLQHLHPLVIPEGLVLRGGILDVGKGNHDITVGGQPREIGALDRRPAGEIFDGVSYGGADAFGDQRIGRFEGRPDRERCHPAAPPASVALAGAAPLERRPGPLQLPSRHDQQDREGDDSAEFDQRSQRQQRGDGHRLFSAAAGAPISRV
ncbi:hypothetical protein MSTO_38320 [Mycobacterium stomatepiae]|uniref:Uncharacterized protein n=1 Tax=Mycobacterium stomatepiae TaxID=470076 RepID=A0A7I7QC73_9MYCO|nr:hypothetical protein MSTO_38320 [Mycobacterium stomatepiae]